MIQIPNDLNEIHVIKKLVEIHIGPIDLDLQSFQQELRNGIYLCELVRCFSEVPIQIYDEDKSVYNKSGLNLLHSQNINKFLCFLNQVKLPNEFLPTKSDIYNGINITVLTKCLAMLIHHIYLNKSMNYDYLILFDVILKYSNVNLLLCILQVIDKESLVIDEAAPLYFDEFRIQKLTKNARFSHEEIFGVIRQQNVIYKISENLINSRRKDLKLMLQLSHGCKVVRNEYIEVYFKALKVILEMKRENKLDCWLLTREEIFDVLSEINNRDNVFHLDIILNYYKCKNRVQNIIKIQKYWRFYLNSNKNISVNRSVIVIQKYWRRFIGRKSYNELRNQINIKLFYMKYFKKAFVSLLVDYKHDLNLLKLAREVWDASNEHNIILQRISLIDNKIRRFLQHEQICADVSILKQKTDFSHKIDLHKLYFTPSRNYPNLMDNINLMDNTNLKENIECHKRFTLIKCHTIHLLPFLQNGNLVDSLHCTTRKQENAFQETTKNIENFDDIIVLEDLCYNQTLLMQMLKDYEDYDVSIGKDNYQQVLTTIVDDLLHKDLYRNFCKFRTQSLKLKLNEMLITNKELRETVDLYEKYLYSCLNSVIINGRKLLVNKSKIYTAQELCRKGVLKSINGLPFLYMKNVKICLKSTDNRNIFEMHELFMNLRIETGEINLKNLLELQIQGICTIELLNKVVLNVAPLIAFIKNKFHK